MSKKKIVILIIMILILAGLVWFFWPRVSYRSNSNLGPIKLCKCFGLERKISDKDSYNPTDSLQLLYGYDKKTICYGVVYSCEPVL